MLVIFGLLLKVSKAVIPVCQESWTLDNECDFVCLKTNPMEKNKCNQSYDESINCITNPSKCKSNECNTNCLWSMIGDLKYDEKCDTDKCLYDLGDSYYSSKEKKIFVNSSASTNVKGEENDTYNSLSLALKNANHGKKVIYLTDKSYKLEENYAFLKKQFFQELIIKPWFCSDSITQNCVAIGEKPQIIFGNGLSSFVINAQVVFENIKFTHQYSFSDRKWQYCGYLNQGIDLNTVNLISNLNSDDCLTFRNFYLFEVETKGSLILTNILFEEMRMGYKNLIYSQGNLTMNGVHFDSIYSKGYVISLENMASKKFSYTNGTIKFINKGSQLQTEILEGFLYAKNLQNLIINGIIFSYNIQANLDKSFFYFSNILNISIINCSFSYNFAKASLIAILTEMNNVKTDYANNIEFINMNFTNNTSAVGLLINVNTQSNLKFSVANINNNFCVSDFLSVKIGQNNKDSEAIILIQDVSFQGNYLDRMLKFENVNKLYIKRIISKLNGYIIDIGITTFIEINSKSTERIYNYPIMQNPPITTFVYVQQNEKMYLSYLFSSNNNYTLIKSAGSILELLNSYSNNDNTHSKESFLSIVLNSALTITNFKVTGNTFDFIDESKMISVQSNSKDANVLFSDLIFDNFAGQIKFDSINYLNITNVLAYRSAISKNPLFLFSCSFESQINLNNANFSYLNQKIILITSLNSKSVNFILKEIELRNCDSETSFISIDSSVYLNFHPKSLIYDSVFINNNGQILDMISNNGLVSIKNCQFTNNTHIDTAILSLAGNSSVEISNSYFQKNKGENLFSLFTNNPLVGLFTNDCSFSFNNGTVIKNDASVYKDYNSIFENNFNEIGAVLKGGLSSLNSFNNSRIQNNEVNDNGCIFLTWKSNLHFYKVLASFNSANNMGGVIYSDQSSQLKIYKSEFYHNYALKGSVIYIQNSQNDGNHLKSSIFKYNNAKIYSAIVILDSKIKLDDCVISSNFAFKWPGLIGTYNSELYIFSSNFSDQNGEGSHLALESSTKAIISKSLFFNQNTSIYESGLTISNSNISCNECGFILLKSNTNKIINCASSNCSFENCYLWSMSVGHQGSLIKANLNSSLYLKNCTLSNFRGRGCDVGYQSSLSIISSSFRSKNYLDGTSLSGTAIYCKECIHAKILLSNFDSLSSEDEGGAIYLNPSSDKTIFINLSSFSDNSAKKGGSIYSQESDLSINSCNFSKSIATGQGSEGGGIYSSSENNLSMENLKFNSNSAICSGGAIQWYGKLPYTKDIVFFKNFAGYGNDIASFASNLSFLNTNQINSAPGQPFNIPQISILDHSSNILINDNSSTAFLSINSPYKLLGAINVISTMGIFNFKDTIILGPPNSLTLNIIVSFSSRNPSSYQVANPTNTLSFKVVLRNCKIGEEFKDNDSCLICANGTYNLVAGAKCESCPSGAVCQGTLLSKKGYWRSSNSSDNFIQCPNTDACLADSQVGESGICKAGYKGNCCHSCQRGYMRTFLSECKKCLSKISSGVILFFILLADIILLVVMTRSSLQDAYKEQSITSTYYKIFVNYCQFISITISIHFSWPTMINKVFIVQERATGGAEQLVVFDCLVPEQFEPIFAKLALISFIPLICISLSICVWLVVSYFKEVSSLKEKMIGSIVVQLFFFQPSIVKYTFSMFNCSELDASQTYLNDNLNISCWKNEHTIYTLSIALPSLLIWSIFMPCTLLILIYKQKNSLSETSQMLKYGFLYKEFRAEKFYWEFFTMMRKLLMICASIFLKNTRITVQGLIIFFIIFIGFLSQDKLKPYKYDQLNKMETWSILASAITIYIGMMFIGEVSEEWTRLLVSLLIITNILFMIYWAYYAFGYYVGKCYLKFPVFQVIFRGKLDDWAKRIAPEIIFDERKHNFRKNNDPKIDNFFSENQLSETVQIEDTNTIKIDEKTNENFISLESEID